MAEKAHDAPEKGEKPEQIAEHEAQLDVPALVAEAAAAAEVFEYHAPV